MIEVNRRNFIKGGMAAAAICLTGCGDSDNPFVVTPNGGVPGPNFLQPPVLQSANGSLSTTFDVRYVNTTLRTPVGSRNCSLRTWNGFVGGPTLRVRPGDRLTVQVNNQLPANTDPVPPDHNTPHHFNTINLHTHGLHVSPSQDDVLTPIPPGTSKTYVYDIPANHPCGTFWYHAHKHGSTAMHLMSGMAGLIIVEGEVDNDPGVAEAAQLDFVIQEINLKGLSDLNADPSATYEVPDYTTKSPFAAGDSFFIVNGAFFPELTVNPGRTIRLRILNGSTRNTMPISVPGAQLTVISLDGITLPQPLTLDTIRLAPANRADVVLRFDEPGTFTVRKEEFKNGGGAANPEQGLALIRVQGEAFNLPLPSGNLTTPAQLPTIQPGEVTESRDLVYAVSQTGGPLIGGQEGPNFTIDGVRFDPNVVNQTILLNSVIEWTLMNTSGAWHSHHIHINPFQVFETSNGMLNGFPLTEPVWLDTVDIPPMGFVKFRSRYPDFIGKYVQHCHILTHEDIGMMQIVEVVP